MEHKRGYYSKLMGAPCSTFDRPIHAPKPAGGSALNCKTGQTLGLSPDLLGWVNFAQKDRRILSRTTRPGPSRTELFRSTRRLTSPLVWGEPGYHLLAPPCPSQTNSRGPSRVRTHHPFGGSLMILAEIPLRGSFYPVSPCVSSYPYVAALSLPTGPLPGGVYSTT